MGGVLNAEFPYLHPNFTPYEHQAEHVREHAMDEYHGLGWETGSCKTGPLIMTAAHHYLLGNIELLVVFAPNTVHSNWIRREIPKTLDPNFPLVTYLWRGEDTKKSEKERAEFIAARGKLKVVSINFEAMSAHSKMAKNRAIIFLAKLLKAHEGKIMGVVDESDGIGDPKATRTIRVLKFATHFRYRRIASGTPATESPFQLYSQSEFLKPGLLGYPDYDTFTLLHGIFKSKKFGERREFVMCVGYKGLPIIREKIKKFMSFKKKADCLDLPPKSYSVRSVELTPEQRTAYTQMKELLLHEVVNTEGMTEIAIAKNALHKLRKLHDVVLGYARVEVPYTGPTDQRPPKPVYKVLTLPHNRIKVLDATIATLEGNVLIFTDCLPALKEVVAHLEATHGVDAVRACYGGVKGVARDDNIDAYENPNSPVRFLVANQKTGGVGLTMVSSKTVIFYSNGYSLRMRIQSEDRAHRGGLKHPVLYIDIVAEGTVDEKVLTAFENKVDVASQIVPLYDYFMGDKILTPEEREALAGRFTTEDIFASMDDLEEEATRILEEEARVAVRTS